MRVMVMMLMGMGRMMGMTVGMVVRSMVMTVVGMTMRGMTGVRRRCVEVAVLMRVCGNRLAGRDRHRRHQVGGG